jgi:hypothetical protein
MELNLNRLPDDPVHISGIGGEQVMENYYLLSARSAAFSINFVPT